VRGSLTAALTAALLAAGLGAAAPARATESGVVVDHIGQAADPVVQETLQHAGVTWVRLFVAWPSMEPVRGQYDEVALRSLARIGEQLHARGMKFELVVNRSPAWASGSDDPIAPPADPADYARMIGHLAGTLRGHVDAWEIWNEEDTKDFWAGGPDPTRYVALLRAAHAAIKAADPGVTVILGGLTANNYPFLQELYEAGAKDAFDAVATHTDTGCLLAAPYDYFRDPNGRVSMWSFLGYRTVREVMVAHGDADKPLFFTEIGWNTSETVCDRGVWAYTKLSGVSEGQQAEYLRQVWHCVAPTPYVRAAFWFNYRDSTAEDTHNGRYGLLRHDGSRKPAFDALTDVSRHGDRRTGPCGDFAAPRIGVTRPGGRVRVTVRDPSGVRKIVVSIDGRRARTVSRRARPAVLRVTLTHAVLRGRHGVTIHSSDGVGNRAMRRVMLRGARR
jgi:hypothetical protein